ncbi:hypothetical protein B0H12DRAFT_1122679, partial [Mycena haematopus]
PCLSFGPVPFDHDPPRLRSSVARGTSLVFLIRRPPRLDLHTRYIPLRLLHSTAGRTSLPPSPLSTNETRIECDITARASPRSARLKHNNTRTTTRRPSSNTTAPSFLGGSAAHASQDTLPSTWTVDSQPLPSSSPATMPSVGEFFKLPGCTQHGHVLVSPPLDSIDRIPGVFASEDGESQHTILCHNLSGATSAQSLLVRTTGHFRV